jgi:hypothetical protein
MLIVWEEVEAGGRWRPRRMSYHGRTRSDISQKLVLVVLGMGWYSGCSRRILGVVKSISLLGNPQD